ncbi:tetratricopeptide repeat protein [uncultured Methanospirillum sp.]|uniref:tetratricopeptide repeat protein n=1 Tax=uncultured Methanospirillum sp. TaxID=262503 RepID=UPI0029C87F50|nr:tetratricopeptide repeat protein [uncultured Methanospirillum sp.]
MVKVESTFGFCLRVWRQELILSVVLITIFMLFLLPCADAAPADVTSVHTYQTRAPVDYDQEVETGIRDYNTWVTAGEEQLRSSKYQEALESFNKALVACNKGRIFGSDKARVLTGKGAAFLGLGRSKEALTAYSEAHDLDPLNTAAIMGQGNANTGLGQYDDALSAYNSILSQDQTNLSILIQKGNALSLQGRAQAAINVYKSVIKIDPANADAWAGEGKMLASLNRHKEAVEAYNLSVTYDPHNSDTWTNYGKSLWILGQYQQSLDAYNKALAILPNDPLALEGKTTVSGLMSRYQKAMSQASK